MKKLAKIICQVGGLCRFSKFPGTLASFFSLILSIFVFQFWGKAVYIILFFIFLILAFWAIKKTQKEFGQIDHSWIGIDELVGLWLANFFLFEFDFSLTQVILFSFIAFILFRVLDIGKFIPPLREINQNPNQDSLNVLLDDLVAGIYVYFLMLLFLGSYNLTSFFSAILLLLTPMAANMFPTLLPRNFFSKPIDEKIFGQNKTWRGFIGAIIFGTLVFFLLAKANLIFYWDDLLITLLVGFLFSFGAIGGDLLKSFFKRKMNLAPGVSWLPFDQIDYIFGFLLLTYPIYLYSLPEIILFLLLGSWISTLAHRLGYWLKINKQKI